MRLRRATGAYWLARGAVDIWRSAHSEPVFRATMTARCRGSGWGFDNGMKSVRALLEANAIEVIATMKNQIPLLRNELADALILA
jgi:hypothetical protein